MNDLSVKPTGLIDPQQSNKSGPATATAVVGLASSFKDMISRVGVNLGSGLGDISSQSRTAAADDNIQADHRADDHSDDGDHSGRDRFGDRALDDRSERNEPPRPHRPDHEARDDARNDARDNGSGLRDENRDTHRDTNNPARDDRPDEPVARADKPNTDDRQGQDTDSKTANNGNDHKQASGQDNGGAGQQQGNTASDGQHGPQIQTPATQAVAGALDAASVLNTVGGAIGSEQTQAANPGNATATVRSAAAPADVQNQVGPQTAWNNTNQPQAQGAQNQQTQTAARQQTDPNAKAENTPQQQTAEQAQTPTRTSAQTPGQDAKAANTPQHQTAQFAQTLGQDAKATNTPQQQTAQLAQTLGPAAKVKIDVSVAQESETLSSRPTATLSAGSALNVENKGQNQAGQRPLRQTVAANQNPQAQIGAVQTQGGQIQSGQAQGGQAQAQNQPAAGGAQQTQSGIQTTSAGNSANGGGIHSAGPTATGGEQATAANPANGGSGTQQSQQAQQTTQTARPHQPLQSSVAEQVSVKITKALQAGQDRITIRLNPAELGRVEVKMELTHDGRTTAIVTADNRDTLDLLRRDSSDLQKALEEGGLQLSDSDLSFNLRGEEGQMAEDGDGQGGDGNDEELVDEFIEQEPEIIVAHEGGVLINGRLDVRA